MSFKTAHEIFEHALLRRTNGNSSIYVKCPRCNKIGRLISYSRSFSGRKYKILHDQKSQIGCCFSPSSEDYSYLDKIYNMYRSSEIEQELCKFRLYLHLLNYSERTVSNIVHCIRKILHKHGEFENTKELRKFLRENTNYSYNMINEYCFAYNVYLRFKRQNYMTDLEQYKCLERRTEEARKELLKTDKNARNES